MKLTRIEIRLIYGCWRTNCQLADDIKVQGWRGVGRPTIDESGEKLEKHMLGSGQIHPAEEKNIRIRRPVTLTSGNGLFLLL